MQKQISIFIIILLIVGGLAFYVGQITGKQQVANQYEQKIKTTFNEPDEIKNISGQIKLIDKSSIKIEGMLSTFNPLRQNQSKEYVFLINDQTKIIKRSFKSAQQIEKEQVGQSLNSQSFSPFIDTEISLSDLKVDMSIEVIAKDNLKNITNSTAEQIIYINMSELAPAK